MFGSRYFFVSFKNIDIYINIVLKFCISSGGATRTLVKMKNTLMIPGPATALL